METIKLHCDNSVHYMCSYYTSKMSLAAAVLVLTQQQFKIFWAYMQCPVSNKIQFFRRAKKLDHSLILKIYFNRSSATIINYNYKMIII